MITSAFFSACYTKPLPATKKAASLRHFRVAPAHYLLFISAVKC